jgi:aminoglycoside adenylyltransferase-like protein
VRRPTVEPGFELELNSGRACGFTRPWTFAHPTELGLFWYAIDRSIARERGRPLFGPPPHQVFAPALREAMLPLPVEAVAWHDRPELSLGDDAVLNACRALRFASDGTWSSKHEAGRWALGASVGSAARETVAAALEARSGGASLERERVEAFLREATRLLEGEVDAAPPRR